VDYSEELDKKQN